MSTNDKNWLSHLAPEMIAEVHGNYFDAYLLALEGWRRGLRLEWHVEDSERFKDMRTWFVSHPGQLFTLASEERKHYFFRTRGDKVTNEAVDLGMDKVKTKEILTKHHVPVPKGFAFDHKTSENSIVKKVNKLTYPLVVKPKDGSFGRDVFTNIQNEDELLNIVQRMKNNTDYEQFMVEEHVEGDDYRLYVVDGEVVGAMLRRPPNIEGNGKHSIERLIKRKNRLRRTNPRLIDCPIQIDDELEQHIKRYGYTTQSVLADGEKLNLSTKCNISLGGDPIGVLHDLSDEIKQIAIDAIKSIDGLVHGAVDVLANETTGEQVVIELNPTAQMGGLLFPIEGEASDIPSAIIDYYFPETKQVETEKHKMYFDFFEVLEPLISRESVISTVTPALVGKIYMKKYVVYGDVLNLGYHLGLRKQAFERELHGQVSIIENDEIEVLVAGLDEEMVNDFRNGLLEDEERAVVEDILEEDFDGYVRIGFDAEANTKVLQEDLDDVLNNLSIVQKEIKTLEVRKRKLVNSTSWKMSKPIRSIGAIFKKKK
ncbi:MAG TPA: acylphosphatase [Pseudogracilibacillus sp.]|nr:acylphosphatase [Pseudogracilibacillus sp.]